MAFVSALCVRSFLPQCLAQPQNVAQGWPPFRVNCLSETPPSRYGIDAFRALAKEKEATKRESASRFWLEGRGSGPRNPFTMRALVVKERKKISESVPCETQMSERYAYDRSEWQEGV